MFYGHGREVLLDVRLESNSIFVCELTFAVNNHVYLRIDRTPDRAIHNVKSELDKSSLALFDLLESSYSLDILIVDSWLYSYCDRLCREVGILNGASLLNTLFLQEYAVVPRFLFETKLAHLHWVFLLWTSRLRNNLTLDIEAYGSFRSVAGDSNRLLEASRTSVRVVGNGDLTSCTWLDRFASPFRSGTSTASFNVG